MHSAERPSAPELGIRLLDLDHREMLEAVQEIVTAQAGGTGPRRVGSLLATLASFTLVHFALEEGMMTATRYPRMTPHMRHHQNLAYHMRQVAEELKSGDIKCAGALASMLALHAAHMELDDMHFGRWLNRTSSEPGGRTRSAGRPAGD